MKEKLLIVLKVLWGIILTGVFIGSGFIAAKGILSILNSGVVLEGILGSVCIGIIFYSVTYSLLNLLVKLGDEDENENRQGYDCLLKDITEAIRIRLNRGCNDSNNNYITWSNDRYNLNWNKVENLQTDLNKIFEDSNIEILVLFVTEGFGLSLIDHYMIYIKEKENDGEK